MITYLIVAYLLSAIYPAFVLIRDECKSEDRRRSYTYGDMATQLFVALFPVVNTAVCVFLFTGFMQEKMRKVWHKRVFK